MPVKGEQLKFDFCGECGEVFETCDTDERNSKQWLGLLAKVSCELRGPQNQRCALQQSG